MKLEEIEMIPKSGKSPADSRKSAGIHEFAALARSSLNGDDLSSTSLVIIYMLWISTWNPGLYLSPVQVSLRQWETTWQSPPRWLRAGSLTSSSGKVGLNLQLLHWPHTPSSAPTAIWLKGRRRLVLLQVLTSLTFWPLGQQNVWYSD